MFPKGKVLILDLYNGILGRERYVLSYLTMVRFPILCYLNTATLCYCSLRLSNDFQAWNESDISLEILLVIFIFYSSLLGTVLIA